MLRILSLCGALLAALPAQSPLTTIYQGGNGLSSLSTIYFDVTLNAPLVFSQFDVNSSSSVGTAGTIEVYWTIGSYVGNVSNASVWTLAATGPVVAAGAGQPSPCVLTQPFGLPAGSYGIGVRFVGIAQNYTNGNGTATPGSGSNQTYSTAELTMLCGASSGNAPGTAICCEPRVFNGSIYYSIGSGGTIAQRTPYGVGCYERTASIYELFATSAAFDLSNSSVAWLFTGTDYVVIPGFQPYVPPSASATVLSLGDDAQTTVSLSAPLTYPGGQTTDLVVCSNGFVSVATGNGTGYTPSAATMLNAAQTGWWNQHDYNPSITSGGRVKVEEIGGTAYVTWDGVWDYNGSSAANANTFQFQFELASGVVHMVFETMSALGNGRLVGYSPGGLSDDPGATDLSAVLPVTSVTLAAADTDPLELSGTGRPVIGSSMTLDTTNTVGNNVGLLFFGTAQIPAPGIDLASIGAAGCPALLDASQAVGNLIGNVPSTSLTVPLSIPNDPSLAAATFYAQSIWLDPAANAAGLITSNGLELIVGTL